MLQFWKKSGSKQRKRLDVDAVSSGLVESPRVFVLDDADKPRHQRGTSPSSGPVSTSGRSTSGPLASLDDEELFELDEQEISKQYSRLSKTLDEVLNDKSALIYFEQFLQLHGGLCYVHCWIDVEQFKLELRRHRSHSTPKEDHDSLSVSTDCDSFTADFSSLCDCSTSTQPDIKTAVTITNGCCCDKGEDNTARPTNNNDASQNGFVKRRKELEDLVEEALRIFKTYVSPEASENVKCTDEVRNEIVENICDTQRLLKSECFEALSKYVCEVLDKEYFQAFLGSDCFCKYQIDILTSRNVILDDILYNETALFYFMEFLEQENETGLLEFWIAASNFQLQLNEQKGFFDPIEAQNDAVILYDKYFSLQAHCPLGFNDKIRFAVEQNICGENGITLDCFHLPLKIVEKVLRKNYLKPFLSSQLFYKYLSELINSVNNSSTSGTSLETNKYAQSDCSSEKSFCTNSTFLAMQIGYKNTIPGSSSKRTNSTDMNIDTRQLYDPDSLWKRRPSRHGERKLAFGTISSLGRYQRNFEPEPDRGAASRFKSAVKKLVNIEEDRGREEMAWKVAEMIVKDITDITLGGDQDPFAVGS